MKSACERVYGYCPLCRKWQPVRKESIGPADIYVMDRHNIPGSKEFWCRAEGEAPYVDVVFFGCA